MTRTPAFLVACLAARLVGGLTCGTADATTLLPLDLKGLTDRAEDVVSGHVMSTRSAWSAGHDAIYTDATLHVDRVLTGGMTIGQDVVVRREGGSVDGIGMMVNGAPELQPGEEVVLFLEHRGVARYIVGMTQGKIDVAAVGGQKKLRRNLSSVHFMRPPTAEEATLAHIDTVDQLEVAVRRFAAARPTK